MALHHLEELHGYTADQISALVMNGFRIDPSKSTSDNCRAFNAVLAKDDYTVELHSFEGDDIFSKCYSIKNNTLHSFDRDECFHYYKSHDDIYADTEEEAAEEHKRWLAFNLGLGDIYDNSLQAFADMLGEAISRHLYEKYEEPKG